MVLGPFQILMMLGRCVGVTSVAVAFNAYGWMASGPGDLCGLQLDKTL